MSSIREHSRARTVGIALAIIVGGVCIGLALGFALLGFQKASAEKAGAGQRVTNEDNTAPQELEVKDPEPQPSGWVKGDDGIARYYDPKTNALVGWWTDEGDSRFFIDGKTGEPKRGWLELEGKRFWLKSEDGAMASHEWVEVDGVWEVFDDDGSWIEGEDLTPPDDKANVANMSDRQRAVIDSCHTTPWQGKGWCAAWVWLVFSNAGEAAGGGDACDIANWYCTSDDLSELKPGMVVATPSHPRTENGKIWGHVSIYVGDGMVMDNGGTSTRIMRLGAWSAWFGATNPVKWGWNSGVSLE